MYSDIQWFVSNPMQSQNEIEFPQEEICVCLKFMYSYCTSNYILQMLESVQIKTL